MSAGSPYGTLPPPATTTVPATTVAPGTVVRQDNGVFEINVPAGWETDTAKISTVTGAAGITAAPNTAAYKDDTDAETANGFTLYDLTGLVTPEQYFVEIGPSEATNCRNFDASPEPFTSGGLTGMVLKIGPCADESATGGYSGYDGRFPTVAVTRPDGAVLAVGGNADDQATEDAMVAALHSYNKVG